MGRALDKLTIKGFKSIRELEDFELTNLNVLIGANGSGKSNFIEFFRLLRAMLELPLPNLNHSSLKNYVANAGGSDGFLYNGPKETKQIEASLDFGELSYCFALTVTSEETFLIHEEARHFSINKSNWRVLGDGSQRSMLHSDAGLSLFFDISDSISSWKIYHFHDTSERAPMRRSEVVEDNEYLRFDASNIAPYLLALRENENRVYREIVKTVQLVAPFFDDFILKPKKGKVRLGWTQKGSDYPLSPSHLSDGTLRFICLATALLQANAPSTIIIDEPELGLHPYAIAILAELIKSVSKRMQLIISTQSPLLLDGFEPEDIVVVDRHEGASVFQRLNEDEISSWLEDYSLGEIWRKNIIAGGPVHE